MCFKQFQQGRNEYAVEFQSPESSFSFLLKNMYEKGVGFLLEESAKEKLSEAVCQLQPYQLVLASKQVLLYLKTTVENFSSVRGFVLFFLNNFKVLGYSSFL